MSDSTTLIPTLVDEQFESSEFDESNPRSLINLLPYELKQRARKLNQHYFEITEDDLRQQLFQGQEPNSTVDRLRISFWEEYDRVQRYKEKAIDIERVCYGICPLSMFWKKIVTIEPALIWILRVPTSYEVELREIHTLGMRAMKTVMATSAIVGGKPNVKLMEIQFKIMQHVDMRSKGAIIQRIDQRHLIAHTNPESVKPSPEPPPPPPPVSESQKPTIDEINARIRELQHQSQRLQVPANVKTVDFLSEMTHTHPQPGTISNGPENEVLSVPGRRGDS